GTRNGQDHVAIAQTGAFASRARIEFSDDDAFGTRQAEFARALLGDRFNAGAEPRAHHGASAGGSRFNDAAHHFGWNGEPDAARSAGLGEDRAVDAHKSPVHVDEG